MYKSYHCPPEYHGEYNAYVSRMLQRDIKACPLFKYPQACVNMWARGGAYEFTMFMLLADVNKNLAGGDLAIIAMGNELVQSTYRTAIAMGEERQELVSRMHIYF